MEEQGEKRDEAWRKIGRGRREYEAREKYEKRREKQKGE